jgi:PTS system fructose-specific IIC component
MFTAEEREQGKAAGVLGAVFISEGAIPFAAANPVRVIPSLMFGGAVAGAATMAFGVTLSAPHGGLLALFAVGHLLGFLTSLALGVGAATAGLVLLRNRGRTTLLSSPSRVRASSTSRP